MRVREAPLLEAALFRAAFPRPLGELATPAAWLAWCVPDPVDPPFRSDDALRGAVRDLLRHAGFKPTGRSKPASEYLIRAVQDGLLGPINPAVDACNAASYLSGLPISVVDLAKARAPFEIAPAAADARYVFNASGQEIDVGRLLCLHDASGPCANAVKDAQRTKTDAHTTEVGVVVWGVAARPGLAAKVADWYRARLAEVGARTEAFE